MHNKPECPVIFEPITHRYYNKHSHKEYTGVSSLLSSYKEEFKATREKTAKTMEKEGLSHEEVLAKWKKKADDSKLYGKAIHTIMENFIMEKEYKSLIEELESKDKLYVGKYIQYLLDIELFKENDVAVEEMLWEDESMISGTCDVRIINKNGLSLLDWKTNEKLDNFGWGKYFYPPLHNFTAGKLNGYILQLNCYAYMAEKLYDLPIHKLTVMWLNKGKVTPFEAKYDRKLMKKLFLHHKENKYERH